MTLQVGIAGAGFITSFKHLPAFSKVGDLARVVALADPNQEANTRQAVTRDARYRAATKQAVQEFWDSEACGERDGPLQEQKRYMQEPEIFEFASFDSAEGLDVLEVGVGMGADFVRWLQSDARAVGVDLTERAVRITSDRLRSRLGIDLLPLVIADCETLPFADASFDVVYSWGVLHHTPKTSQGISEAVRVLRPGGRLKVMLYHRRSWFALAAWIRFALLRGRPFRGVRSAISYVESPGTQAFLREEVLEMLHGLEDVSVEPHLTHWDRRLFPLVASLLGDRFGWHLLIEGTRSVR